MILYIAIIVTILILDQASKYLIVSYLPEDGFVLIKNVLRMTYVENRGMAFGMLDDKRWIFISVSSIGILIMCWYLFFRKPDNKLLAISLALIIGGGIGNMIDRVFLGYVIDFIDFCAIPNLWVWVFNVADASVCVGAGLMLLYLVLDTVKEFKKSKSDEQN